MKDERLYAKFTLDFPDSPKIMPLPVEAKWALVEMTIYCRRMLTDGFLSKPLALAKWGVDVCLALSTNDPSKPSLVEVENGYQIHDFGEHQSTRAEIDALTEKRRSAGQKGGQASAKAKSKQVLKQKRSKSNPETETQTGKETTPNGVVGAQRKRGQRLPEGWKPSEITTAWAKETYGHLNLALEFEKFTNHWTAASGQSSRKLDWDAAFRNWLHNARAPAVSAVPPATRKVAEGIDLANRLANETPELTA